MYDMKLVAEPLRLIAQETAAALGPEWRVDGLLSTAFVVHPIGHRIALDNGTDYVQLTAHVSISPDKNRPLETVLFSVGTDDDRANTVRRTVEAIHTKILPHFGRQDAVAGVRVLCLPLREAGIPAIVQGTPSKMFMDYRRERLDARTAEYQLGERRPLGVVITSTGNDDTRVDLRIPHLTLREAARITRGMRPGLRTPLKNAEALPVEVRNQAATTFTGLTAKHVTSNVPRLTDLSDGGALTIRHAMLTTREDDRLRHRSWWAVWLREATVAQAYTILRAYAA